MNDRVEEMLAYGAALDAERMPWNGLWQDLADVVHPRRGTISNHAITSTTPDRTAIARNYDGTAMRANQTLANGQAARITPMGNRWFGLRPPTELANNPAAIRWYQQCGEILERKLAGSNFYNRAHEHYLDRGAFGIAATEIVGGKHGKGLHFRSFDVGTYSVAQDEQDEVDTITRVFQQTPKQLLQRYGRESLPETVLKYLEDPKESLRPLQVRHTIQPRLDRDPRRNDGKNKAFLSVHLLVEAKHILFEGSYDEFPVACSRWGMWGNSPYGWAPSYYALPEANQVNYLQKMMDVLAEVAANPRVLYSSALKGDIDFKACGLTCWDPSNGPDGRPQEWLTGGRYDIGKDRIAEKQRAIDDAFYVPLFNSISTLDRNATATEVRAIVNESRELFHPIFANLIREFLSPILKTSFAILLRQGEFPTPPQAVIQSGDLGGFIENPAVEYTSSMALALEQSQLANFADCVNVLAPLQQTDPGIFDFVDTDALGALFFRYKGLPESIIRPPEQVAQIRDARAQQQQAATAAQATSAVKNLGGAKGLEDLQQLAQ